jgi:Zn-dependent M28 family amino/carboxypeptidase
MRLKPSLSIFTILIQLSFLVTLASSSTQQKELVISTPEEFKGEFDSVPCKDEDRLNAVKVLFEKMGATQSDISIEKYKNVENLVVRKQGTSEETIVIGAHYDKVADGCGALDNWTGIVAVTRLYKSLRNDPLRKTILFVAFGKEETGLTGSRAMVGAVAKDHLAQYCEMINFDSLGLAMPQVADNMSSKKLGSFAADVAKELRIPFNHAIIEGADADSSSFIAKKIPAITIHGMTNEWPTILHTRNDQPAKVKPVSVYLGYRLALAMVIKLDNLPCGEYR